jgi:hypothetical protein
MIAIEMSGDFTFREFASNRRELARMIESAKSWLFKQGYREFVRESRETLIAYSKNGGRVQIAMNSTSPDGVRI